MDFVILRYSVVKLMQHRRVEKELPAVQHVLLTLLLLYGKPFELVWDIVKVTITLACMIFVLLLRVGGLSKGQAFGVILDFAGGIAFSVISFIFPSLVYLKHYKDDGSKAEYYYNAWAMLVFGVFTFFVCPIMSILSLA